MYQISIELEEIEVLAKNHPDIKVDIAKHLYKLENVLWDFIVTLSRNVIGNALPKAKIKKLTEEEKSVLKYKTAGKKNLFINLAHLLKFKRLLKGNAMKYWVFTASSGREGAILALLPEGGPKKYRYSKGQVLLDEYKAINDPAMVFDSNHPDHFALLDVLSSVARIPILSGKVKTIFQEFTADSVEFLPVKILDHRLEIASENYFILNPIGSVDVIDMDKSDCVMGSIIKDQILRIKYLVVNTESIPKDAHVFRASSKLSEIFVSDEVRKSLKENKVTGYELFEAEGWDCLGI